VAVYERAYRGYSGVHTPAWSRFLVLPRYGLQGVFASRFFLAFFVACFIPALALLIMIYLSHNAKLLQLVGATPADITLIDAPLFMAFLVFEGKFLGLLLAMIVGPALIAPDMLNNALPLYLSRPFNRTEYILGKLSVLVLLLSAITWIPYLFLFALQGYMSGWEWTQARLHVPGVQVAPPGVVDEADARHHEGGPRVGGAGPAVLHPQRQLVQVVELVGDVDGAPDGLGPENR